MEVRVFDSGDDPYLEWMENHPEGYVLNVKRKSSSGFSVFHDSGCFHISGVPSLNNDSHTQNEKIKVCAEETKPLVEWLRKHRPMAGAEADICGDCEPDIEEIGFYKHPDEETEPETHEEGSTATVEVNRYERSAAARRACLEHYGAECQVCGLQFEKRYGDIGEGWAGIEVHHVVPLSETEGVSEVDPIEDLKPVCPNCHAMLHQKSPPLTIEELRERLSKEF